MDDKPRPADSQTDVTSDETPDTVWTPPIVTDSDDPRTNDDGDSTDDEDAQAYGTYEAENFGPEGDASKN